MMPLHPLGILCYATALLLVLGPLAVLLIRSPKRALNLGYALAALLLVIGVGFSFGAHLLVVSMAGDSGDEANSPLWWMLFVVVSVCTTIAMCARTRAHHLQLPPGSCQSCGNDMRDLAPGSPCTKCGKSNQ